MSEGSAQIRILAVDDHGLVRQGIAVLISSEPELTLVGEASNGREAIQQYRVHRPDITLMDLQTPEMNGLDALVLCVFLVLLVLAYHAAGDPSRAKFAEFCQSKAGEAFAAFLGLITAARVAGTNGNGNGNGNTPHT